MEIHPAFRPLQIGDLLLPHRIIMGSMHLGLEKEANAAEQLAEFYSRRFAGGVSLITTGGIAVNEAGKGSDHFFNFRESSHIKKLEKLVKLTGDNGHLCAQLFHAGRYAFNRQLVAPSAIRAPINRYIPREMAIEDIRSTVNDFANAALAAKNSGFAAVEIMGSEGYLLNEFFSAVTNHRTDAYGQNRLLLISEIAGAVREAVGSGFPVIFRMSGIDLIPGNPSRDEVIQLAQSLETAGMSALNIGIGWHESRVPTISSLVPRGAFAGISKLVKESVSIPVIASNRVNDTDTIENILNSNSADIISMARPFLADPDFINKYRNANQETINTCIACNQACLDHAFSGKRVSCLVNPEANREKEFQFPAVKTGKSVTVIGAGPAGMQAALTLARNGFAVELIDRNQEIGGQLLLALTIPGKSEFAETIRYFKNELKHNHVTIRTGAGLDTVADSDYTVFATGTRPRQVTIPGMDNLPHALYDSYLRGEFKPGKNVLVIGGGGIGCDVAYKLVRNHEPTLEEYEARYNIPSWTDAGIVPQPSTKTVSIMRRNGKVGAGLGMTTGWAILQELAAAGVSFYSSLAYERVTSEGIIVRMKTGEELIAGDSMILCAGQESSRPVLPAGKNVFSAGSVTAPMDAKDSFLSGLETAKAIIESCR